jgi:GRF zinc finger
MWSHVVRQTKPNSYRVLPSNSNKSDGNNINKQHGLSSEPSLLSDAPHFKPKKNTSNGTNNANMKTSSTSNTKTTSVKNLSVARTNPSTAASALLDRTNVEENRYSTSTSRLASTRDHEPPHRVEEIPASTVITTSTTTATTAPSSRVLLGTAINAATVTTTDNGIANTIAPPSIYLQHQPSQGRNRNDSAQGNTPASLQGRCGTSLVAPSSSLRIGLNLKGGGVADARKNQVSRSRLPPRPLPRSPHEDVASNNDASTLPNVGQYIDQPGVPTTKVLPPTSSLVTTSNYNESQPTKGTNTATNSLESFGFSLSSASTKRLSFASSLASATTNTATKEKGLSKQRQSSLHNNPNDNFVRQNLRNSAGACRGARNKKRMRKKNPWNDTKYGFKGGTDSDPENSNGEEEGDVTNGGPRNGWSKKTTFRKNGAAKTMGGGKDNSTLPTSSRLTGLDPLDDYLDGMFQPTKKLPPTAPGRATRKGVAGSTGGSTLEDQIQQPQVCGEGDVPKCPRHQKLCKCLKVKKASTGNKGRKFYVCSMPRGEQCDFFQWDDDTVQVSAFCVVVSTQREGTGKAKQSNVPQPVLFFCYFRVAQNCIGSPHGTTKEHISVRFHCTTSSGTL